MISKSIRLAGLLCLLSTPLIAQTRVLNVFNWSDYIDMSVIEDFTKETGIKVVYDTYDSNEALETKLFLGRTGYDVAVPSATFLQRQIQAGIFQKLDRDKLKNYKNLSLEIMSRLATYDPNNQYSVNYMWYTTGISFNAQKIKARLGGQTIQSWGDIYQVENLKKLADCGVYFLDSPEDMLSTAARFVGVNPDLTNASDLKKAADVISKVKPFVKKFHSSEYINALSNGDICLAVGWAGDSYQARARAQEAHNGIEIDYVIPKEGTLLSFDNLAILKDAPHVEEAYLFIDFLLRPEIAARNTNVTNYANAIPASQPFISKEILENKSIYPDQVIFDRLYALKTKEQGTQKNITREWTRIKTGK